MVRLYQRANSENEHARAVGLVDFNAPRYWSEELPTQLRDHFIGVGVKKLSAVDAELSRSNQHEIGVTRAMREQFLGAEKRDFESEYVWIDDGEDALVAQGAATYYDSRAGQPNRSPEWRLYYSSNPVTEAMREGDTLFLALDTAARLHFIVTPSGSSSENQLLWMFDLAPPAGSFASKGLRENETELGYAARFVLDQIGVAAADADAASLDAFIDDFGLAFPTTRVFSQRARESLPTIDPLDDPDRALEAWMDREEALFRRLERRIVAGRLEEGFVDAGVVDVDGFVKFSLSVQNRRKARAGQALENHAEVIFRAFGIDYVRGAITEKNRRPDFVFPSLAAYRAAPVEGDDRLTMLGAKSSCKERWTQVLEEAAKIRKKHLLTLEPGIAESQTVKMRDVNVQLVVPLGIHPTYRASQRAWLWTLREFVDEVAERQGRWA